MPSSTTFVASPGLSALCGAAVRTRCARNAPPASLARARRAQPTMTERGRKKKAAAPVFATDMKGNFVWTLRSAAAEDAAAVAGVIANLPESIVACLVEDSACCVVCEASVKGTKEGTGYSGKVLGAALADVSVMVREDAVVKRADFVAVAADASLPDPEDVMRKLVLGCLKKLKAAGVVEVTSDVAADRGDRIELLQSCLFSVKEKDGGRVRLTCRLAAENPDPQKKVI